MKKKKSKDKRQSKHNPFKWSCKDVTLKACQVTTAAGWYDIGPAFFLRKEDDGHVLSPRPSAQQQK